MTMVSLAPSLSVLVIFTLLTLTKATAGSNGNDAADLFAWARQHGAKIADRIEVKVTAHGGRGLFAKEDIPANTELVQIPYRLQLGVRQLAEGTDEEMQGMARRLPWEYIRRNELFFLPLSVALVAEKRKGESSLFGPFFRSLPKHCPNAVGPASGENDDLGDLRRWAPRLAGKVQQRRTGIQYLHAALAPASVSLEELRWAAANVCSRSLIRKRVPTLTPDQVERIGAFPASDHSRMLPVIDLVNHGSLPRANVWVGHLSREGDDNAQDFSTSLKSTRDIRAGEELLFDYGGGDGEKISNDRLLLDYGFVLPAHTAQVSITREEFDGALSRLEDYRAGMKDVPQKDREELHSLVALLVSKASEAHGGAPLMFLGAGGEPSMLTLAVAIAMTCRGRDDATRVLSLARQPLPTQDAGALPRRVVGGCAELQQEFARFALKVAAGVALERRSPVTARDGDDGEGDGDVHGGEGKSGFAIVAQEYAALCCAMLQEVADMSR